MSDIADFLRARILERRALAQSAKPGPWCSDGGSVYATHPTDEVVSYSESADHIAANDPAAVIADCDAKLSIIEEAQGSEISARNPDHDGGAADALSWVLWVFAQQFAEHGDFKGDKWSSPDGRADL